MLKDTDNCYGFVSDSGPMYTKLMSNIDARIASLPYTKLSYIAMATSPVDLLERAIMVTTLVTELDRIRMSEEETLACAIFLAFMCRYTDDIISKDKIRVTKALGTDWYTSVTCSNINWIKSVMRTTNDNQTVNMTTDINSLLGSMAIGNMCRFSPFASWKTPPTR